MAELVVTAPVFNEEKTIGDFLAALARLRQTTLIAGLVLVDDGSSDASVDRIREFARSAAFDIRLIRLSRNFGHQNAVLAGLHAALEWKPQAGWVGLIDSDMQDDPADFAALLNATPGHEVVYALRASRAEGMLFRAGAALFYWLINRFSAVSIPRNAGTFSVMTPRVTTKLLEAARPGSYIPGVRAWLGFRQRGIELHRRGRQAGRSRVGLTGLVRLAISAMLTHTNLPLQLLTLFSASVLVISTLFGIAIIILRYLGFVEIQGVAAILAAVFFSLGVQSIYLSVVAFMIARADRARAPTAYVVSEDEQLIAAESKG